MFHQPETPPKAISTQSETVPFRRFAALAAGLMLALLFTLPARAQITFPSASPISAGNLIVHTQPTVTEYSGGLQSFYDENILLNDASPDLAFIFENKSIVSNSGNIISNGKAAAFTAIGFGEYAVVPVGWTGSGGE